MARKSNTDKLYAKLLIFAEELHMGNKRRIRNGFISLAVLPVLHLFLDVPYGMGALLQSVATLVATGWLLGIVFMLAAAQYVTDSRKAS